ncbi:uncharacterized protein LOC106648660 isoform X3 [Trichogramma pretiosum]|uniref:uncharacterized protein LOC106648660 isoform X3 n=1 Tax=Trichogramma pretiosum TaxID=7493 RepID=UPI0006C994F5|nr:uncharacterized protein LOC106648660 isoform X3 [Trichogramma pretiosum]
MPCAPDPATNLTLQVEHQQLSSGIGNSGNGFGDHRPRFDSSPHAQHQHHRRQQQRLTDCGNDDPRAELSARAVDYLLNCHQELLIAELRQELEAEEEEEEAGSMAATAKHERASNLTKTPQSQPPPPTKSKPKLLLSSSSSSSSTSSNNTAAAKQQANNGSTSGDEDIAAIAKQISDHAEAIYQTWKSRGLAPTEILNCHTSGSAADKFGTVLKPAHRAAASDSPIVANKTMANNAFVNTPKKLPTSPVDILAQENNNLEKLVNNFVVEDKARIAAARQRSPSKNLPSSIQFALQKFEQNAQQQQQQTPLTSPKTPTQSLKSTTANSFALNRPSQIVKPSLQGLKSPQASHHNDVFLESIDAASPFVPKLANRQVAASSPLQNLESSPVIGGSWPLKNKIVNDSRKQPVATPITTTNPTTTPTTTATAAVVTATLDSPKSNAVANLMDQVAREEEKLINALKTGAVISEDPSTVPIITPTTTLPKQKPVILRETKPKVEPVKPILLSPSQVSALNSVALVNNVAHQIASSPTSNGVKQLSKDELSSMSVVDFAKVRYQTAQQNSLKQPQLRGSNSSTTTTSEEPKSQTSSSTSALFAANEEQPIVSTTRSKFEAADLVKDMNDKDRLDKTNNVFKDADKDEEKKEEAKDDKDFIASRWGLRLNSPRPRPVEQVPHPELTTQQKQHIRAAAATNTGNNPVRPFLTRGSVAERVLIFEKCPSELMLDKRGSRPSIGSWRSTQDAQNKAQRSKDLKPPKYQRKAQKVTNILDNSTLIDITFFHPCRSNAYDYNDTFQESYNHENGKPAKSLPAHTTLQRHVKANRNVHIPRFYFPGGKPTSVSQLEATLARITAAFQSLPGHRASRAQFHTITKACDLPLYWKIPLFLASGGDTNGIIEMNEFLDFWKELTNTNHDAASKFVRIVTRGQRPHILPADLIPLIQDVVESHPGLTFLKEATEFHSRYVHTVIARIFYCVNRSWSDKISVAELRRSNLLSIIAVLEHEEDINQVTAYFSYEHFYVIYCKFWELDRDHDLFIDKMDLTRHNDHALSTRMIERIFSGAVTRGVKSANGVQHPEDKMSYTEFVWFLLSEEDKNHPTAIEYWFRCMDLDGDGLLSMYELEYFYEEQLHRMEAIGIETLPFEDCLCQMLDMIKPKSPGKISLSDLKRCKMTSIFFDTFFNLEKYLDHEQRDPFASARDHDAEGHELSDWDRFAAEEYELLVAEESGNDQNDRTLCDDE